MDLISRENVNNLYLETFYSVDHFNYGQKFRFLERTEMKGHLRVWKMQFSFCSNSEIPT